MVSFGTVVYNPLVADTLKAIFPDANLDLDFVDWMSKAPTGKNKWFAAYEHGQVVALYGLLPLIVHVGGKHYTGCLCNNVGVVPAYRRRGLFVELGRYALKEMRAQIAIGIPNPAALPGHIKVGWEQYGKLVLMRGELTESKPPWFYNVEQFRYTTLDSKPYFHAVRGSEVSFWRYRKPGTRYRQTTFGPGRFVVWKEYMGRRQVMEADSVQSAQLLCGGVDVWCFEGTKSFKKLKAAGFRVALERDFILHTDIPIKKDLNKFRFEACDFDTF